MEKNNQKPWDFLSEYKGKYFFGEWPTFPELLTIQSERYANRPCFTDFSGPHFEKKTLTYSEVYNKVVQLAKWMIENGVQKGDRVVVSGKNSPEWAVTYLATLFASGIIVPLDDGLHELEAINLVKTAEPKFLFVDEKKIPFLKDAFPNLPIFSLNPTSEENHTENIEDYVYNLSPKNHVEFNEPVKEDDTALILFTSGTTGNPKGVMLSHKNIISDGYIAQTNFHHNTNDVFYALLPIHHAYTMQAAFINPLEQGGSIVFGKSMAVSRLLKELKDGKITIMLGVPLLYNKLLAGINKGIKAKGPFVAGLMRFLGELSYIWKKIFHKNIGKKLFKTVLDKASIYTLRVAISGGGPLAASVCKQYNSMGIDFIQGYGLTETSPIITLNPVEHFKIESVGKDFYPYEEIKIINKETVVSKQGVNTVGEIVIKGPMVMQGYYKMPEETAKMFTEDGFLKTGDLGWMDKDRYVMLCGREKNLIVTSGGKNVYPEEIENAFQLYDDIKQVTIRGYIDNHQNNNGEEIEALIYPSDDLYKRFDMERNNEFVQDEVYDEIKKIVSAVNKTLQSYSQISKITILKEPLEMTTTQKVKRNYVPKAYVLKK